MRVGCVPAAWPVKGNGRDAEHADHKTRTITPTLPSQSAALSASRTPPGRPSRAYGARNRAAHRPARAHRVARCARKRKGADVRRADDATSPKQSAKSWHKRARHTHGRAATFAASRPTAGCRAVSLAVHVPAQGRGREVLRRALRDHKTRAERHLCSVDRRPGGARDPLGPPGGRAHHRGRWTPMSPASRSASAPATSSGRRPARPSRA